MNILNNNNSKTVRVLCASVALCAACLWCAATVTAQTSAPATSDAAQTGTNAVVRVDDGRVPLTETALARGAAGDVVFAGTLRSQVPAGSPEAPVSNVWFVIENRGTIPYSYLAGRVTFYDAGGVRCGEGLFTINSLVAGESAESDAPGLRLTAAPVAWRVTPVALVTAGSVVTPAVSTTNVTTVATPAATNDLRLTIDINGTRLPVQLGSPVEVEIGGERVRVIVERAQP